MQLLRLKDNEFYIAYRRNRGKETACPLYCIYRTDSYGGDMLGEYRTVKELWRTFVNVTKEAKEQESTLKTNS